MEAESIVAVGVEDLDAAGVLARPRGRGAARPGGPAGPSCGIAYQWCVLHPATTGASAATWGDTGLPGLSDCDASLGGDGTPGWRRSWPRSSARRWGSPPSPRWGLMADALDLLHRFPQLWAKVEAGQVAPWKTRRVATDTRSLPFEARPLDRRGARRADRRVRAPDHRAAGRPRSRAVRARGAGRQGTGRGVRSPRDAQPPATRGVRRHLLARGRRRHQGPHRLPPARLRHRQAARPAGRHRRLRDPQGQGPRHHRRPPRHPRPRQRDRPRRPVRTNLYVHVSLAELATHPGGGLAVGEVEKLGPATLDLIRTWLHDSKARIQPVLDLNRTDAVDQHDPPPWMRERVILRDRHCVFPWCGSDARQTDLDHIAPYVPMDDGGPPGQTHPATSRRCVDDITAPRPSPAGTTNAPATAPTPGPAPRTHLDRPTGRHPPYHRARTRPSTAPADRTAAYTLAT